MRDRVSIDRDEMDRLVLMRSDVDRYEAQLIPDLNTKIHDLTLALKTLVAAIPDDSGGNLAEAAAHAKRVLRS